MLVRLWSIYHFEALLRRLVQINTDIFYDQHINTSGTIITCDQSDYGNIDGLEVVIRPARDFLLES